MPSRWAALRGRYYVHLVQMHGPFPNSVRVGAPLFGGLSQGILCGVYESIAKIALRSLSFVRAVGTALTAITVHPGSPAGQFCRSLGHGSPRQAHTTSSRRIAETFIAISLSLILLSLCFGAKDWYGEVAEAPETSAR